ncbi:keywimysin-related RiPP [Actinomadura oligospora]|nr:keywimysin-related RiPP [Actinomadura oligospora]
MDTYERPTLTELGGFEEETDGEMGTLLEFILERDS